MSNFQRRQRGVNKNCSSFLFWRSQFVKKLCVVELLLLYRRTWQWWQFSSLFFPSLRVPENLSFSRMRNARKYVLFCSRFWKETDWLCGCYLSRFAHLFKNNPITQIATSAKSINAWNSPVRACPRYCWSAWACGMRQLLSSTVLPSRGCRGGCTCASASRGRPSQQWPSGWNGEEAIRMNVSIE